MQAPLVVGYKGEIGRFILAGLLEDLPKANDIYCVDISNSEEDVRERIRRCDFLFLCVPLQDTAAWLQQYGEELAGKVVVEQCSVKNFLYEDEAFNDVRFLSMHLLFRPSATPILDRRCLVFSDRISEDVVEAFANHMARALKTEMSALGRDGERPHIVHDRLMAKHQALVHRVILTLARSLEDDFARTFVGQRVTELAERIRAGDPVLYKLIQENRFTDAEVGDFVRTLSDFSS